MSEKTVAEKARVKPGATIAVLNRVPDVVESLGLPEDVRFVEATEAELVFLFVNTCRSRNADAGGCELLVEHGYHPLDDSVFVYEGPGGRATRHGDLLSIGLSGYCPGGAR